MNCVGRMKPVMEFVFSFALLSSNTILLGLQTDENKMEELETFIKRIETLQAKSELVLVEMSKNEHGHKALCPARVQNRVPLI